jgi:hypothetical protein
LPEYSSFPCWLNARPSGGSWISSCGGRTMGEGPMGEEVSTTAGTVGEDGATTKGTLPEDVSTGAETAADDGATDVEEDGATANGWADAARAAQSNAIIVTTGFSQRFFGTLSLMSEPVTQ